MKQIGNVIRVLGIAILLYCWAIARFSFDSSQTHSMLWIMSFLTIALGTLIHYLSSRKDIK